MITETGLSALDTMRTLRRRVDAVQQYRSAVALAGLRLQGNFEEAAGFAVVRRHQLELLEGAAAEHICLLHEFVDLLEWTGAPATASAAQLDRERCHVSGGMRSLFATLPLMQ